LELFVEQVMDLEERRAVEAALGRFAEGVERALFAGEGADGDLERVPSLLAEAREMGVLADPAPDAPGYELGVWGRDCHEEGLRRSLLTLESLGRACAGFAAAVHAQGLACLALDGVAGNLPTGTPLAVFFMPNYGIPIGARARLGRERSVEREAGGGLRLSGAGDDLQLDGASYFALAAEAPARLVCFAQGADGEWASLLVDAGAAGLELTEVMGRTGLRAVLQYDLRCEGVLVPQESVLRQGDAARRALERVLACDWLGQAAISLGVARRALQDSRAYAAQRYQGGKLIQEHASVQLLQGSAEYDVALLEAMLYRYSDEPLASLELGLVLRWALGARLAVVEHAQRAVTNCLQVLGGYGYMEDYGFEKRLRDVSTLKSLHGAPDQLRLLLNELARGDTNV
jgi:alkylation response protein AidB-like acyl-CoA dehydrogenase